MASRPVFIPDPSSSSLVRRAEVEFVWHAGMSLSQKQKCVRSLHTAAGLRGFSPLLEISGASEDEFGKGLSAFSLRLDVPGVGHIPVECAFQGSKVFDSGGPYQDLYTAAPRDAKTDSRIKSAGRLMAFRLLDEEWPILPKTAFYDWLYVSALVERGSDEVRLLEYAGFTDIQFNPSKSINCQAYSAALYVSLHKQGRLAQLIEDRSRFLETLLVADVGGSQSGGRLF